MKQDKINALNIEINSSCYSFIETLVLINYSERKLMKYKLIWRQLITNNRICRYNICIYKIRSVEK